MKVLLLCGSIAQKSHTKALLQYLAKLFEQKGIEAIMWDLKDKPLPFVIPEYHRDPTKHPDAVVREFIDVVNSVDGVVLGSPLYHGSYPGVLKNALDNLQKDAFRDKWVGLVGNSADPRADHVQFADLRNVIKTLYGYAMQTQIGTAGVDYKVLDDGFELVDESIKLRCQRFVDEMMLLVQRFQSHDNNQSK